MGQSINKHMKLQDILEAEGGGYPAKHNSKDKTKPISRLLRRKSDRSNPNSEETELNPDGVADKAKDI